MSVTFSALEQNTRGKGIRKEGVFVSIWPEVHRFRSLSPLSLVSVASELVCGEAEHWGKEPSGPPHDRLELEMGRTQQR